MRSITSFCLAAISAVALSAAEPPRKAQPEALPPDRFSEAHAPLFQTAPSRDAAALTEKVVASIPGKASGPRFQRRNFVDEHVFGKMERNGIPHAGLASDGEFLRRASLDLTGRIPASEELKSFVADTDPAKRDKLIDRLLASDAYVDKWAYYFMDLFRANGKMGRGQNLFHYWMKENLRVDRPYDDVVRSIIAAAANSAKTWGETQSFAGDSKRPRDA